MSKARKFQDFLLNLGAFCCIIMLIVFFIKLIGAVLSPLDTYAEKAELKGEITAGEVVDKYTKDGYTTSSGGNGVAVNPSNGGVNYVVGVGGNKTYVPIRYYITIKCEYEYKGELIEDTRDFQVERDVYLAYKIGDYFDIQDFRYVSESETITT